MTQRQPPPISTVSVLYELIRNQSDHSALSDTPATIVVINHAWFYGAEAVVGVIVNLTFINFAVAGMRARRLPTVLYLFLVNRSTADIVMQLSVVAFSYVILNDTAPFFGDVPWWEAFQRTVLVIALAAATANVYVSLTCYWCLSAMVLISVRYPLVYQRHVTGSFSFKVIGIGWLLSVAFGVVRVRPDQPQGCHAWNYECIREIESSLFAATIVCALVYFSTLFFYGFVTWEAIKHPKLPNQRKQSVNRRISFKKLGMGVGTFAVFNAVLLADRLAASLWFDNCLPAGHICRSVMVHPLTYHCILIRTIVDPIAGLFADARLQSYVAVRLGLKQDTLITQQQLLSESARLLRVQSRAISLPNQATTPILTRNKTSAPAYQNQGRATAPKLRVQASLDSPAAHQRLTMTLIQLSNGKSVPLKSLPHCATDPQAIRQ